MKLQGTFDNYNMVLKDISPSGTVVGKFEGRFNGEYFTGVYTFLTQKNYGKTLNFSVKFYDYQ